MFRYLIMFLTQNNALVVTFKFKANYTDQSVTCTVMSIVSGHCEHFYIQCLSPAWPQIINPRFTDRM